ncbi:MAG: type II and III secretion system protein family protein [Desulfobacteraceae bacterium]|nr:type II and III secretion system protein family protein [Desulfobacteraceae bacterium]
MSVRIRTRFKVGRTASIALIVALLILSFKPWAVCSSETEILKPQNLKLVSGKSIILKSQSPITRISDIDTRIATVLLLSPRQIYITGKAAGITNLIVWHSKKDFTIHDIEVVYDISRLKQRLHEILPSEKDIRVMATSDSITLSGRISNISNLSQAMALAEAFVPKVKNGEKCKVLNLLEVGGIHQVMLEVRIAEMKRTLADRLGINLGWTSGLNNFGITTLGGLTQVVSPSDAHLFVGSVGLSVSSAVNALLRFNAGGVNWTGFLDAMKEDGLVKILAEPTLITLSGQTATFLAGGEFPVPVPQGLGTVGIEFKQFGVSLEFTPTVLTKNKISIQVAPEVSELDFSTAQQIGGFIVPGLTTRKASTVVELGDGQSFAIAGLLKETIKESISRFPLLGDIPILGALFRSSDFKKDETELVIIVTPHIVKPLDTANQPLPTDYYVEPNYMEFFLMGQMEGRGKKDLSNISGELDGDFGHDMPAYK